MKIDYDTVQFTAIAAGKTTPIGDAPPRDVLHYSTLTENRKTRNL
jgi:hypothetical protein